MTVDASALAQLHAECFTVPRPWNEAEFASMLDDPTVIVVGDGNAFALGRVVVDEAELLTIAVAPDMRRQGKAAQILAQLETEMAARGAASCFLEVAANNVAAIALYSHFGYAESGRRRGYYGVNNAPKIDAVIMTKHLIAP